MLHLLMKAPGFYPFTLLTECHSQVLIRSLSKDDGDANENGKKVIGFDWQNNNFARASRFFVHFLAVVARLQRESA